ncbi:hypothetical protein BKA83DRAFT_4493933 [Pisolithus microcarpus]|nr:hypothetical protein BKA83DRAFT_4493933 [Pisolithus microcarpus]
MEEQIEHSKATNNSWLVSSVLIPLSIKVSSLAQYQHFVYIQYSARTLLSQYSSHNLGEPYNYVGALTGTISLAKAPSCV